MTQAIKAIIRVVQQEPNVGYRSRGLHVLSKTAAGDGKWQPATPTERKCLSEYGEMAANITCPSCSLTPKKIEEYKRGVVVPASSESTDKEQKVVLYASGSNPKDRGWCMMTVYLSP